LNDCNRAAVSLQQLSVLFYKDYALRTTDRCVFRFTGYQHSERDGPECGGAGGRNPPVPAAYRTVTAFHMNRLKIQMSALNADVSRMLRQTAAVKSQNVTLRQLLQHHAVIQPVQQVTTIVFCTMVMKEV